MWSYFSKVIKNFYYREEEDDFKVPENGIFTDKNYLSEPEVISDPTEKVDNPNPKDCFRKSGKITFLSEEYGLIDNTWYFDRNMISKLSTIKVGDQVSFIAYQAHKNEVERVIAIEVIQEGTWDSINVEENPDMGRQNQVEPALNFSSPKNEAEVLQTMERVLHGKVTKKKGMEIRIEPLNIWCNLNNVKSEILPFEGDWLSIRAAVSVDVNAINFSGEILDIKHIAPLMVKNEKGTITYAEKRRNHLWDGLIENIVHFCSENCEIDFVPSLGDSVEYKAVESDQGKCKWRATSVRLVSSSRCRSKPFVNSSLLADKNDIVIVGPQDFGTLMIGSSHDVTINIKNLGKECRTLVRVAFRSKSSQLKVIGLRNSGLEIEPGSEVTLVISCNAKFLGIHTELLVFHFKDFEIGKIFNFNVSIEKEKSILLSCDFKTVLVEKSEPNYSWKSFDRSNAVYGHKPIDKSRFARNVPKIPSYNIPQNLFQSVVESNIKRNSIKDFEMLILNLIPCLKEELSCENYAKRFHASLYLEEISQKIFYRTFDMTNVILRRRDQYLCLDVSSITDSRTLFAFGGSVIVTQPWSEINTSKQIGYIHDIIESELLIKFHSSFHSSYDESICNVSFEPTRSNWIKCHYAVDMVVERLGMSWLFPTKDTEKPPRLSVEYEENKTAHDFIEDDTCSELIIDDPSMLEFACSIDENGFVVPINKSQPQRWKLHIHDDTSKSRRKDDATAKCNIKWYNEELNKLQKLCVVNILEARGRPLPHIVFGPPGTGKTVTLLEAILQIYNMISDSRIIIGTPSNSASDIICRYLIRSKNFTPGEIVRILSFSRAMEGSVPEEIIPYCAIVKQESDIFNDSQKLNGIRLSTLDCVGRQRIVIGTLSSLCNLHQCGLKQGHFSHIFIDEACQATEPEALIPISFLDPKNGQVILCGDPEQLGPICLNPINNKVGLRTSLFERISKRFPYVVDKVKFPKTNGYDPRFISKLNVNYRSVPDILHLPSKLFYDSELIATVSQETGPESEIIRKFDFKPEGWESPRAIIFHGIRGQNYKETCSTSWYNPLEIWQVVCYLKKLYALDLNENDVGIIAPYQKQVEKLRRLLAILNVPIPKIGSVEEFQGQERNVIILSTVRSSISVDETDPVVSLGFICFPRRVNVAITRARALLIIVGNPLTLSLDPYWHNVVQYCLNTGGYTGCSLENRFVPSNI